MKRRFGMLIGIICILIVGFSVTRMTKEFLVSNGVEASSILDAADSGLSGAATGGGLMGQSADPEMPEKHFVIPEAAMEREEEELAEAVPMEEAALPEETDASSDVESAQVTDEDTVRVTEIAFDDKYESESINIEETIEETGKNSVMMHGLTTGPGASAEELEAEMRLNDAAAIMDAEPSPNAIHPGGVNSLADAAVEEEPADGPGSKLNVLSDIAVQESVKSPLDPAVETEAAMIVTIAKETFMTAEDFSERFVSAEAVSEKLWEKTTLENIVAYQAASEQERVLWDYELNYVYGEIRSRMSEKEAEDLKHKELEWLKERDQYAEKMASKSPIKSAQNQNPAYTRALAEKTKDRCYWLVSEYEEVLNREPDHADKKNKK